MTDREALLKSIRDEPGEDTPRLVFADYLEENNDEGQAQFIRNHIEYCRILTKTISRHQAFQLSGTKEVQDYVQRSPDAVAAITHHQNSNRLWGLPMCLFGIEIIIDPRSTDTDPVLMDAICDKARDPRIYELQKTIEYTLAARYRCRVFEGSGVRFTLNPLEGGTLIYHRGFVDEVICNGPEWLQWGEKLADNNPIRVVNLSTGMPLELMDDPKHRMTILKLNTSSRSVKYGIRRRESPFTWYTLILEKLLKSLWPTIRFVFNFDRNLTIEAGIREFGHPLQRFPTTASSGLGWDIPFPMSSVTAGLGRDTGFSGLYGDLLPYYGLSTNVGGLGMDFLPGSIIGGLGDDPVLPDDTTDTGGGDVK